MLSPGPRGWLVPQRLLSGGVSDLCQSGSVQLGPLQTRQLCVCGQVSQRPQPQSCVPLCANGSTSSPRRTRSWSLILKYQFREDFVSVSDALTDFNLVFNLVL